MGLDICAPAADLLHGALDTIEEDGGWVRPVRFAPAQMRALGSVCAWHPGLYRQLAACTAGICLEFGTDASRIEVEVRMGPLPRGTKAVLADVTRHEAAPEPPFDGLSAEVDGRRLPLALPDGSDVVSWSLDDPDSAPAPGLVRLPGMGEPHRVRVWLPCLSPCSVRDVRADGSYLEPVAARDQLLVLGDSIAQGYVCCDPGRSWAALLAGRLGLDLVNQGVGGQVFQPGSLAGAPGRVRPAAVVVEFGENYRYEPCSASRVERDVRAYLREVAEAFPSVPTWVLTPLPHAEDVYPTHPRSCASAVDGMIRAAAARHPQVRVANGGALLEGERLGELLADGSDHPSPAGHELVADRLSFVMDATAGSVEDRRARALAAAEALGDVAFPVAECLRRGLGNPVVAERGALVVDLSDGSRMLAGTDRRLLRRALACLGRPEGGLTCVCGGRGLAREVTRALGGHARSCHLALLAPAGGSEEDALPLALDALDAPDGLDAPAVPPTPAVADALVAARDIRPLAPACADTVRGHCSHAEYLAPGELEAMLAAGRVLGGFEDGQLVGFVGEHAAGSMGMLEIFEGHRRAGWGTALLRAKVAQHRAEGGVAWAEIWPRNRASLALVAAEGFEVRPADQLWFVS